jgi:virulence-associated protein VagC
MSHTPKIFSNNPSQVVRMPNEPQSSTAALLVRKQGDEVIPAAQPSEWTTYVATAPMASEQFTESVEDLPVQERTMLE